MNKKDKAKLNEMLEKDPHTIEFFGKLACSIQLDKLREEFKPILEKLTYDELEILMKELKELARDTGMLRDETTAVVHDHMTGESRAVGLGELPSEIKESILKSLTKKEEEDA